MKQGRYLAFRGIALAAAAVAGLSAASAQETLTFWDDIYTDDSSIVAQKEMIRLFEEKHPGVTVEYVVKSFAQFVPTAKLALAGDGAPDVVICAYGETCNGELVRAGLVIPTQKYADQYDWTKGVDPALLPGLRFTAEGKWGEGEIYGFSETYDLVGLYYNKEKLAALGHEIPKSMTEFEQILADAKAAGETPIQLGDLEKSPLAFVWFALMDYSMPTEDLTAWIYHKPGATIVNPGAIAATEKLKAWYDAGYFSADLLGQDLVTAVEKFDSGDGVFLFTGAWFTGLLDQLGDNASFTLVPPPEEGGKYVATHTLSNPVMITAKAENPDLAAEFVNWITGWETAQIRANAGMNTTRPEAVTSVPSKTQEDVLAAFKKMQSEGSAISFLDVTAPGMLTEADTGLQNVLGGVTSVEDFLVMVQEIRDRAANR